MILVFPKGMYITTLLALYFHELEHFSQVSSCHLTLSCPCLLLNHHPCLIFPHHPCFILPHHPHLTPPHCPRHTSPCCSFSVLPHHPCLTMNHHHLVSSIQGTLSEVGGGKHLPEYHSLLAS